MLARLELALVTDVNMGAAYKDVFLYATLGVVAALIVLTTEE